MNRLVRLVANGINVTAETQERALAYLKDDAAEFRRDWNYVQDGVDRTDEEPHEDGDCASIDVEVDRAAGHGDRTWTGCARFSVVFDAEDDESAYAAARSLLAA